MKIKIKTEDAVEHFGGRGKGGVQALADKLNVTHGAISQWGEYVPEGKSYKLYVLTDGKIKTESPSSAQHAA